MNEKLFLESFGIYITSSYSPLRYVYHIIKAFPTSTDFETGFMTSVRHLIYWSHLSRSYIKLPYFTLVSRPPVKGRSKGKSSNQTPAGNGTLYTARLFLRTRVLKKSRAVINK